MIEKANIFRQMRDTKPLIRAGIMVAEYHLSNDHFSPPPACVCESWLFLREHADSPVSSYFMRVWKVPAKWVSEADTQSFTIMQSCV